jgi:hypothetical protein
VTTSRKARERDKSYLIRDQLVAAIRLADVDLNHVLGEGAGIPARRRLSPLRSAVIGVGYVGAHGQLCDAIRLDQHWFR